MNLDGTPPADNPFAGRSDAIPAICSYGHRNIQAAALDAEGRLWVTEHGPQGGDELNLVEPGANYGWPVISYGQNYDGTPVGEGVTARDGMEQPRYYWDPVIAPSGMAFYDGAMFPAVAGRSPDRRAEPARWCGSSFRATPWSARSGCSPTQGRIRDVEIAPDGAVLALTDADDGRLLRLTPERGLTQ